MSDPIRLVKNSDARPLTDAVKLSGTDFSGCTAALNMVNIETGVSKVTAGSVTVSNAAVGSVDLSYPWAAGELDTPGFYRFRWTITLAGGALLPVPDDWYYLQILATV